LIFLLARNTSIAYFLNFLLRQQFVSRHQYFVLSNEIQTHLNSDVNDFCYPHTRAQAARQIPMKFPPLPLIRIYALTLCFEICILVIWICLGFRD